MIRNSRFAHMGGPYVHKFGYNADIDLATDPEDIWIAGGLYAYPSAAAATTAKSSSTDDDGAPVGTGAQTLTVEGLDTNLAEVSQTVTMDGTTAVALPIDLFRVNRAYVRAVGSGGVNAGTIDVLHGATVLAQIAIGKGQTQQAIYTVPTLATGRRASLTPYLTQADIQALVGAAAIDTAIVDLFMRDNAESWRTRHSFSSTVGIGSKADFELVPILLTPGTDIRLQVTSVTADNMGVFGQFYINWIP